MKSFWWSYPNDFEHDRCQKYKDRQRVFQVSRFSLLAGNAVVSKSKKESQGNLHLALMFTMDFRPYFYYLISEIFFFLKKFQYPSTYFSKKHLNLL